MAGVSSLVSVSVYLGLVLSLLVSLSGVSVSNTYVVCGFLASCLIISVYPILVLSLLVTLSSVVSVYHIKSHHVF